MILFISESKLAFGIVFVHFIFFLYLQDLPKPNPVKCKIPQKLFGDAMMLMEFLYAFGDQLSVQEEFPEGVTLGKQISTDNHCHLSFSVLCK